jgi:hypothetical protein
MPSHLFDLLLTLLALFNSSAPTTATTDTGSILEPNG